MRISSMLLVAAFALFSAVAAAHAKDLQREFTSICAIGENPQRFDGQELTVRGIFASDYFEYSSLIDPTCRQGLAPWNIGTQHPAGEREFNALLCDEQGGLVEVTVRGRLEARPGEIPTSRFYVLEYSDPRHVEFDPNWVDPYGVLASEAGTNWLGERRMFCIIEGFVDPETFQRRASPQALRQSKRLMLLRGISRFQIGHLPVMLAASALRKAAQALWEPPLRKEQS